MCMLVCVCMNMSMCMHMCRCQRTLQDTTVCKIQSTLYFETRSLTGLKTIIRLIRLDGLAGKPGEIYLLFLPPQCWGLQACYTASYLSFYACYGGTNYLQSLH